MKVRVEKYDRDRHFEQLMCMKLRDADERELLASTGLSSVAVGLSQSVEKSDIVCWMYLIEDRIIAVSGAAEIEDCGFALVWAMATEEALVYWEEIEPLFIAHVHDVLNVPGVNCIGNIIDIRNTVHIKWVKKLGFTFTDNTYMIGEYKFESFYKGKS